MAEGPPPVNVALVEYLQMLLGLDPTGILKLNSGKRIGAIWLESGRVVHAEFDGKSGQEGCHAMLALSTCTVNWKRLPEIDHKTCDISVSELLMNFLMKSSTEEAASAGVEQLTAFDRENDRIEAQEQGICLSRDVMAFHVMTGSLEGTIFELDVKRILVGSRQDCDMRIKDPTISRYHSEIVVINGKVIIRDLGSKNGTDVNGELISVDTVLNSGDRFRLGQCIIRMQIRQRGITPQPHPQSEAEATQPITLPNGLKVDPSRIRRTEPIRWFVAKEKEQETQTDLEQSSEA